jgi:Ankyrin repeats (3 copies)
MDKILPLELLHIVTKMLTLQDYTRLRAISRSMRSLDVVPSLSYKSYRQSTIHYKVRLRNGLRMKLVWNAINDESFLYLATNGHADETARILTSHKQHLISMPLRESAYFIAVEHGFTNTIIALLDSHVSPALEIPFETIFPIKAKILQWACYHGQHRLLVYLIERGHSRELTRRYDELCQWNCLHFAAAGGEVQTFQYLLSLGLDVNAVDSIGRTALHLAAMNGHLDIVEVLLDDTRTKLDVLDAQEKSVAALANECECFGVAKKLKSRMTIPNPNHNTTLLCL